MMMARTRPRQLAPVVMLAATILMGLQIEQRGLLAISETERHPVSSMDVPVTEKRPVPQIVDIVHLYNPFRVLNCVEPFCPYDQAQSVAIASMERAQAKALKGNSSLSTILAAVTFPDELDIIPNGFVQLDPLTRSTVTEYPNMTVGGVPKRLPFWQDILQSLLNQQAFRAHTIIYTNSDIILHENFYSIVHEKLQQGNTAFTINRQTILAKDKNVSTHRLYTANDLDEIFNISKEGLEDHPGTDCFVFPWDMALKFDLDKIFVGYPPFGLALASSLMHYTAVQNYNNRTKSTSYTGYRRFETSETKSTFHLGNDLSWREKDEHNKAYTDLNRRNAEKMPHFDWNSVFGPSGLSLRKVVREQLLREQRLSRGKTNRANSSSNSTPITINASITITGK
jgi:hypothetical protein